METGIGRRRFKRTGGLLAIGILTTASGTAIAAADRDEPREDTIVTSEILAPTPDAITTAPPLVVADPRCTYPVVYEIPAAVGETVKSDGTHSALFYRPADGIGGAVVELRSQTALPFEESIQRDDVELAVRMAPDGSGIAAWLDQDGQPIAVLSGKRLTDQALRSLAESVFDSRSPAEGFERVAAPTTTATVHGSSCRIDGNFVGVEVVSGSLSAQLTYLLNVDPTTSEDRGTSTIVEFNRHDGGDVVTQVAETEEWARLLANSEQEWNSWLDRSGHKPS